MKGVRQEVIDAIDVTEPYKGGKGYSLWQLNALNKIDKHELLVGTGSFYAGVDLAPTIKAGFRSLLGKAGRPTEVIENIESMIQPLILRPSDNLLALKVGDELFIEPIDEEVAKDRRFGFSVSFNAPAILEAEPALKTVQDMASVVDDTIVRLGKFLP